MTRFIDGPAEGESLQLKRSPTFLRVVENTEGKWDALDIPEDTPDPMETIHVYILASTPGRCHMSCRGKGPNRSGWWMIAEYKLCSEQPGDGSILRDNSRWVEWVMANKHLCDIPGAELAPHLR